LQLAWVIAWDILLPAFTVGAASYIALLEGLHLMLIRRKWFSSTLGLALALGATAAVYAAPTASPAEASFLADNQAAMDKMMANMAIKPSGDIDQDFAAMMIPHHQGAIDMAKTELRYGHNEQLRRIAQEIIVEQQQEIVAMHLALGQPVSR